MGLADLLPEARQILLLAPLVEREEDVDRVERR